MNAHGISAGMNTTDATQAMLCSAVVELKRTVADLNKAIKTQQRKYQQRLKEMVARISSLEGTVHLLRSTVSFSEEKPTAPTAVPTTVAAPPRRRKRSDTDEEEEDSQGVPLRAPKKRRRTGSVTKVSF